MSVRQFELGQAKISLINIGDIHLPLAQYLNVPESEHHHHGLAQQSHAPIHNIHIQLPNVSILVDAGVYDVETYPAYAIPDYVPPASLIEQLSEIGIQADSIDHVIITHRHWDHINGTTYQADAEFVPQFPNATYYLGRADWERSEENRNDPIEVEYHTLRVLDEHDVLQLIDAPQQINDHIEIIPAAGETQGHQIVRVQSDGKTLFCLGDLYHHPIEFRNIEWMVSWARPETTLVSREMLLKQALSDDALLIATHIPDIGRLIKMDDGLDWETVT